MIIHLLFICNFICIYIYISTYNWPRAFFGVLSVPSVSDFALLCSTFGEGNGFMYIPLDPQTMNNEGLKHC